MDITRIHNFLSRLLFSAVSILILLILVGASYETPVSYLFAAAVALTTAVAQWEYYKITAKKGFHPLSKLGIASGIAFTLLVFYTTQAPTTFPWVSALLFVTLIICFVSYFKVKTNPLSNTAITLFGILYLAAPLSCVFLINYYFGIDGEQDGRIWLFYAMATTKMTDTGAYFSGKILGRHHLAPHISPHKTIEGTVGGILASIGTSIILPMIFGASMIDIPLFHAIVLGAMIGILATLGDLGESVLKRDAGVKDSNRIPGVGGILDISDSLIFTLPVVYFYLTIYR
jgi:phosphatidate cytidylyltransferase